MRLTSAQVAILETLCEQWQGLEPGASRLVVVDGEPGSGKTAVVQALYRRVHAQAAALDSDWPLLWPSEIALSASSRAVARKLVAPQQAADAFGRLGFAWLGRACRSTGGGAVSAGELGPWIGEQLAHTLYVEHAQADHDVARKALAVLVAFLGAGGGVLVGGPAITAGVVVDWTQFGREASRLGRQLVNAERAWRAGSVEVGRLPWGRSPPPTRAQLTLRGLEALAALGVPCVVAIEDAHLADQGTVALCRVVIESARTHALVVATADAGPLLAQIDAGEAFGGLLAAKPRSRYRPLTVSLASPHRVELERIAAELLATVDAEQAAVSRVVAASGGNLELLAEAAELIGQGMTVDESSYGAAAVIRHQWEALPAGLRVLLATLAALQGELWCDQPLDGLAALPRHEQEALLPEALARGLLLRVDSWRLGFASAAMFRLAREEATRIFTPTQVEACRADLFASIAVDKADAEYWGGLPPEVQATALRTQLGLYPEPGPPRRRHPRRARRQPRPAGWVGGPAGRRTGGHPERRPGGRPRRVGQEPRWARGS